MKPRLPFGSIPTLAVFVLLVFGLSSCKFDASDPPGSQGGNNTALDTGQDGGDASSTGDRGLIDTTDTLVHNDANQSEDSGLPPRDTGVDSGPTGDTGADSALPPDDTGVETDVQPDTGGADLVTCGDEQVDLLSNTDHCGSCGRSCDAAFGTCDNGVCTCTAGLQACGTDYECYDTQRDALRCGSCSNTCAQGAYCNGGSCVCRPGLTECNGRCVSTRRDPLHCGGCGNDCGSGRCEAGQCKGGSNCGWQASSCTSGGKTACLPHDDRSNSLYCAPTLLNACGNPCEGNEVCRQTEWWSALECRTMRPARDCTQCPCADCGGNEICLDEPEGMGGIYCMES